MKYVVYAIISYLIFIILILSGFYIQNAIVFLSSYPFFGITCLLIKKHIDKRKLKEVAK